MRRTGKPNGGNRLLVWEMRGRRSGSALRRRASFAFANVRNGHARPVADRAARVDSYRSAYPHRVQAQSTSADGAWPETLWTIGHSTRSLDDFIALLRENRIETLADVRHFPGSRKYPQFNIEPLRRALQSTGIAYESFTELGGRRKVQPDSTNTGWRHPAFRGYADYMQTDAFRQGIERLKAVATAQHTAIMCAEAVWWRCHRGLVSDVFKLNDTRVLHIMGPGAPREHPWTSAARVVDGRLDYSGDQPELPTKP